MNVAVCDDQTEVLKQIKNMLKQMPMVKKIAVYSDMEIFFSMLEETSYDVVLMDIDWKKEETGIDLAERIQRINPITKIIYITAYTMEYVEDVFLRTSNLSGFLTKPIKAEQLKKNLQKIQKEQKRTDEKLAIKFKGNAIVIPFRDIIYLENCLHKVRIVLTEKEYWCYERLEHLKERLNEQFLYCHKSYIVNMEQILEFRKNEIEMVHGSVIPVSKTRYKEAKDHFFRYMSEHL